MSVSGVAAGYSVPSGSSAFTFASVSPTAGTWTEAITATSGTILIVGLRWDFPSSLNTGTMEIGTGAAASEVSILSWFGHQWATGGNDGMNIPLTTPIRVSSGTRVAVKASASGGTAGFYWVSEGSLI